MILIHNLSGALVCDEQLISQQSLRLMTFAVIGKRTNDGILKDLYQ